MRKNYLCYVDNKTMLSVPDDIFECFLHHLDEMHPEYLVMQDENLFYHITMYFVNSKLVAFSLSVLD